MKKKGIFMGGIVLVLLLALSLGTAALSPDDVEMAFLEDSGNYVRTVSLPGADNEAQYALHSSYGWFTADGDGGYRYELDPENEDVTAARTNGKTLSETINTRYTNAAGGAVYGKLTFVIQPAAAAVPAGQVAVSNDGTAAVAEGRFFPANDDDPLRLAATSCPWGEYAISDGGEFTYTLYNWSRAVQTLSQNEVMSQTLRLRCRVTADETHETDEDTFRNVIITVRGANDLPSVESFTHPLTLGGETVIQGCALTGSKPGDGWDAQHTLTWGAESAAYGTITREADGSYVYTLDDTLDAVRSLEEGDTLTETFTYAYKDKDGDTTNGSVTVTVEWADLTPTVNSYYYTIEEDAAMDDDDPAFVRAIADVLAGCTLGNGTAAQHHFTWTSGAACQYATGGAAVLGVTAPYSFSYTLDNASRAVQNLYPQAGVDDPIERFYFTFTDSDGSVATGCVGITVCGVGDAPEALDVSNTAVEDGAPVSGNVRNQCVPGDGLLSEHEIHWEGMDADADGNYLATLLRGTYGTLLVDPDGSYTYTVDNSLPAVQGLQPYINETIPTLTDVFGFDCVDVSGAASSGSLTVTITGANDVPSLPSPTNLTFTADLLNLWMNGNEWGRCTQRGDDFIGTPPAGCPFRWETVTIPTWLNAVTRSDGSYSVSIVGDDSAVTAALLDRTTLTSSLPFTITDGNGDTYNGTVNITFDPSVTP